MKRIKVAERETFKWGYKTAHTRPKIKVFVPFSFFLLFRALKLSRELKPKKNEKK